MARSLAGTQWKCTDPTMPEFGMGAVITDGDIDPDWNGENEIEFRYQNEQTDCMTLRRFQSRFKQIITPQPTNVIPIRAMTHVINQGALC